MTVNTPTHSPAPWIVMYDYDNIRSETIKGRHTIQAADDYNVARVWELDEILNNPGLTEANARLTAAACNSYDKHCGPRAVECAEADLLGELLAALELCHSRLFNYQAGMDYLRDFSATKE